MTQEQKIKIERHFDELHTAASDLAYPVPDDLKEVLKAAYRAGAGYALDIYYPRWISVEDELPNDDVDVLTVNKFNFQVVCFRFRGYWFSRYGNEYNDITHWMPLPEKLKKGGEE